MDKPYNCNANEPLFITLLPNFARLFKHFRCNLSRNCQEAMEKRLRSI